MENKRLTEFSERLKSLNVEQLVAYKESAKKADYMLTVAGVSLILLMMFYPVLPIILFGSIVVFVLGKSSEGLSLSVKLVVEQISKLEKTR